MGLVDDNQVEEVGVKLFKELLPVFFRPEILVDSEVQVVIAAELALTVKVEPWITPSGSKRGKALYAWSRSTTRSARRGFGPADLLRGGEASQSGEVSRRFGKR